jgi:hypothetical protein
MSALLSARILFRFAVPCRRVEKLDLKTLAALGDEFALPALCELEGQRPLGVVKAAWNDQGIGFAIQVSGKKHPLWCRANRLEDSDGIQLYLDTRDTKNIHRASRFCHRFAFLPLGGGRTQEGPVADQMLVERARENANPVRPEQLGVACQKSAEGYLLCCHLTAQVLTGFNPVDHQKIGFTYRLFDRELGEQTFSCGPEFPYPADPSLWGTLELVRD